MTPANEISITEGELSSLWWIVTSVRYVSGYDITKFGYKRNYALMCV